MDTQNEFNVLVNGRVYRVVDVPVISADSRQWPRKAAPREEVIAAVKLWGVTHVLGGTEDEAIAIPIDQASEVLLQLGELMRPRRQGDTFLRQLDLFDDGDAV